MLETMCHSLQSQEQVGFGTGLVQALGRQVICFHSRSGAALHCCNLALVMTPGWSAAGGGFCGSTVHLLQVINQKRVRVFDRGFQTPRNR